MSPTSALVATWYSARSWLTTCPSAWSVTDSSCSAIDRPMHEPADELGPGGPGVDDPAGGEHARASAAPAPRRCPRRPAPRRSGRRRRASSSVFACGDSPVGARRRRRCRRPAPARRAPRRSRRGRSRAASTIAEPQEREPGRAARARAASGRSAVADRAASTASRSDAERVGGDLGQRRPRAGADVRRRRSRTRVPAVAGRRDRGTAPGAVRAGYVAGRDAGADQPAPLARACRGRVAAGPAEPLGARAQALHEVPAGPGQPRLGVGVGLVADPQLDRVDADGDRQLVHRRLQREHARGLPRRPHPRRRRARRAARAGASCAGAAAAYMLRVGDRGLLGELLDPGGLLDHLVAERRSAGRRRPRRAGAAGWSACGSRRGRTSAAGSARTSTGRPHAPARPSRRARCGRAAAPLEPKPPPTYGEITRTCSASSPNTVARSRTDAVRRPGWSLERAASRRPTGRCTRAAPSGCCAASASCRSASTATAAGGQRRVDVAVTGSVVEAGR